MTVNNTAPPTQLPGGSSVAQAVTYTAQATSNAIYSMGNPTPVAYSGSTMVTSYHSTFVFSGSAGGTIGYPYALDLNNTLPTVVNGYQVEWNGLISDYIQEALNTGKLPLTIGDNTWLTQYAPIVMVGYWNIIDSENQEYKDIWEKRKSHILELLNEMTKPECLIA